MSLPGTIPVMVDTTECRGGSISVPVKEVVTDELRTFRIQELDETCPSHPDEMDELKSDIKLEIEGECENANNLKEFSNTFAGSKATTISSNTVTVAKVNDLNSTRILIQASPNSTENISATHFHILSPASTNGTNATSAIPLPSNDRAHVQANVIYPYPLQTIPVPPAAIVYSKPPDYKPAAVHYQTPQTWGYPAYVPNSSQIQPGSYIQSAGVPIGATYQVVCGIPPGHIQGTGTPIYGHQVVLQPPNASVDTSGSVKPQQKEKRIHIKKPLNAFMLFMKEQRAKVIQECTLKESAAINQILGKMWHALDKSEQAKYYEMARKERANHMQLYPSWSARDNYASKTKRKRKKKDSDCVEGEARKCRARFVVDHQQMWCNRCRKRRQNFKSSESNSLENGSNGSDGDDDYCKCDTQSNIITDTVSKLLAKKDQFFSDSYTNGQVFCSQSSERNNSQDSNPTSRDYESGQEPSDDEGTILTTTSHPSMLDQDLDDTTAVQF